MFKDNFITICRDKKPETLRIYKSDISRFLEWLGERYPDFNRQSLDMLIEDYLRSLDMLSLARWKQVRCALNYQSKRVVKVNALTKKSDTERFSELVLFAGKNGVPKAPSPI